MIVWGKWGSNKYTISVHCLKYKNKIKIKSSPSLFRSECKLILYSPTMYGYYVYPAISKGPKQLPNCLK